MQDTIRKSFWEKLETISDDLSFKPRNWISILKIDSGNSGSPLKLLNAALGGAKTGVFITLIK